MKISGNNFINAQQSSQGNITLYSYHAESNQPFPFNFHEATTNEINSACESAFSAFQKYRLTSIKERATFLDTIADEIDALDNDFIEWVMKETALPRNRILGERARTTGQMRLFADVVRRGDFLEARIDQALESRNPPRPDLRQIHIGIGPIAVFGASNFPLAFSTAGGDTASALAAGCSVVIKANPSHMITAEYIAHAIIKAVHKCKMPAGVFNMVHGGKRVGIDLVSHSKIKAVGFTGSLQGGKAIFDIAMNRPEPIPVFAEMSSINPVILLPHALRDKGSQISKELANSVVLGCGQFCTNPGLIISLRSDNFNNFINNLKEIFHKIPAQTMLSFNILENYKKSLELLKEHHQVQHLAGELQQGTQAYPQLFQADASLIINNSPLLQEEIFGPTTILIEVDNQKQLKEVLERLKGQLTITLMAEKNDFEEFASLIPIFEEKAGRLLINGYPTGVEVCDAMVHGGPYPATTDVRSTSVGTLAIDRYLRPVCYQNYPQSLLPEALHDHNPLNIKRLINGEWTKDSI